MVICLERGANDRHMVQLMPLFTPISLASLKSGMVLALAYPGCLEKRPLNGCTSSSSSSSSSQF